MAHNMPKISIIVPVYQAERFIAVCIRCVLAQSFSDWELLLIDDGCRDETYSRAREFLSDSRIRYILHPNGGPSSARNLGLQTVRSEFIYFMDADDYIHPQLLSLIVSCFRRYPEVDFVSFDSIAEDPTVDIRACFSPINEDSVLLQLLDQKDCLTLPIFRERPAVWYTVFRRELIEQHQLRFCESIRNLEDADFLFRYFYHVRKGWQITAPLYAYIRNPQSLSRGQKTKDGIASLGIAIRSLTSYYAHAPQLLRLLRETAFPRWVKISAKGFRNVECPILRSVFKQEIVSLFKDRCIGFKGFSFSWCVRMLPLLLRAWGSKGLQQICNNKCFEKE